MAMPETPVDHNDFSFACKHQIRFAGKLPVVQSEAETQPMYETAHRQLRGGVLTVDATHTGAPVLHREIVHTEALYIGPSRLKTAICVKASGALS
jgi:hypothetical protein